MLTATSEYLLEVHVSVDHPAKSRLGYIVLSRSGLLAAAPRQLGLPILNVDEHFLLALLGAVRYSAKIRLGDRRSSDQTGHVEFECTVDICLSFRHDDALNLYRSGRDMFELMTRGLAAAVLFLL